VAALETIRLLEEGLMQNAADMGAMLTAGLRTLSDRHLMIGDVRGLGLMIGIELVKDRHTKIRAGDWRDTAVQKCFKKGLLILGCGENSLRLMPPLIVNREQAEVVLEILDEVFSEIEKEAS
jgi:4-aminobutyrate aminotransferase